MCNPLAYLFMNDSYEELDLRQRKQQHANISTAPESFPEPETLNPQLLSRGRLPPATPPPALRPALTCLELLEPVAYSESRKCMQTRVYRVADANTYCIAHRTLRPMRASDKMEIGLTVQVRVRRVRFFFCELLICSMTIQSPQIAHTRAPLCERCSRQEAC